MHRLALRLLLALCLILNGMGNAMAAVAGPDMPGVSDGAVTAMIEAKAPSSNAACGHAESAPVTADPHRKSSTADHPADCANDRCAQGACTCPCMHIAQAALLAMAMVGPSPGGTSVVPALALGHSTPVQPNLIRPPIG